MTRRTLRDVASLAGVSKATASRVLNESARVDPETRDRVLAAIAELDYAPSATARNLSFGRTLTLGIVTSYLTRPQAAERLRGVDAVLADSGFDQVIRNVETVEKRDQYLRGLTSAGRIDGLLVISLPLSDDIASRLIASTIPVVVVDAHTPAVEGLPHVIGDDVLGGVLATQHLLAIGHRRIAYIGDAFENPFGFTSSRHRYLGFEAALRRAGLEPDPRLVALGDHGRYQARELAARMLVVPDRPTAIFAASDMQALGAMTAAREAGLRIPEDLSVVGYDDLEIADYVGLTTVHQRLFESGRAGAEMLLAGIRERSAEPSRVLLPPQLVIRGTTAPPKEGRD